MIQVKLVPDGDGGYYLDVAVSMTPINAVLLVVLILMIVGWIIWWIVTQGVCLGCAPDVPPAIGAPWTS